MDQNANFKLYRDLDKSESILTLTGKRECPYSSKRELFMPLFYGTLMTVVGWLSQFVDLVGREKKLSATQDFSGEPPTH